MTGTSLTQARKSRQVLSLAGLSILLGTVPGCQSLTGIEGYAQIRVIDASPDAGSLDVYQGPSSLAYNLELGTLTSYVPIAPGTLTLQANVAGTHQQVASQTGSFAANGQYTVLIGNTLAGLQETVLRDQVQPAPAGQVALRIVHESVRAGLVDMYLVPTGATISQVRPLLSGAAFGQNSGYRNMPAGTYTLVTVPAGALPVATPALRSLGPSITYQAGSARTIVLIDQNDAPSAGLQVIVATDFDPGTQGESK